MIMIRIRMRIRIIIIIRIEYYIIIIIIIMDLLKQTVVLTNQRQTLECAEMTQLQMLSTIKRMSTTSNEQ